MNWETLNTEREYQKAIARTLVIFHAHEHTNEAAELAVLLPLIKDYENKHVHLPEAIDQLTQ
jgi:HTH-type transcriptional regulator / antitoxin HigA